MWARSMILLTGVLFTMGCSMDVERPGGSLRIDLDDSAERLRETDALSALSKLTGIGGPIRVLAPSTAADFNCFAVNVTGVGVPSMSEELSGCETTDNMRGRGIGILSEVFIRGSSVEMEVPAGLARRIDVYGIFPDNCTNTSSTNGGDSGGGFFLGGVTKDLAESASVVVPISYSGDPASVQCYGGSQGGFHISSVFPYGGNNGGGWSMNVNGGGFSSGLTITVNGVDCPVNTRTEHTVNCTVPSSAATGNVPVVITNGPNQTETFSFFQYVAPGTPMVTVDKNTNDVSFGSVSVASGVSEVTIRFANMGDTASVGANPAFSGGDAAMWAFKGGTAPGTGGDCPISVSTLGAFSSCTVVVEFDPSATGARTTTLNYFGMGLTLNGEGI